MVFNAYFTVSDKSGRTIRLQFKPIFAVFCLSDKFLPRIDLPASVRCHYYLVYLHFIYWKMTWNVLGDFGANWVHFGSKIGTPNLHKIRYRIICVLRILHVFFRIKHLWSPYDPSLALDKSILISHARSPVPGNLLQSFSLAQDAQLLSCLLKFRPLLMPSSANHAGFPDGINAALQSVL